MKRLHRYVLVEFARTGAVATGVFLAFMITAAVVRFARIAEKTGADFETLVSTTPYFLPYLLSFSLPMGCMIGAIVFFGKLRSSGELTAMLAAGFPLQWIAAPVIWAALLVSVPQAFMLDRGMAWCFARARRKVLVGTQKALAEGLIPGKTFQFGSKGRMGRIHVFEPDAAGHTPVTIDVFTKDGLAESIVALNASFSLETQPSQSGISLYMLRFDLSDGFRARDLLRPIFFREGTLTVEFYSQVERDITLGRDTLSSGLSQNIYWSERHAKELNRVQAELERVKTEAARGDRQAVLMDEAEHFESKMRKAETEFYLKLSLCLAPFALTLLGIPLGLMNRTGGRAAGFAIGTAVALLVYYPLWIAGQGLAISGGWPPQITMWVPNALAAFSGAVWMWKWERV